MGGERETTRSIGEDSVMSSYCGALCEMKTNPDVKLAAKRKTKVQSKLSGVHFRSRSMRSVESRKERLLVIEVGH